MWNLPNKITLLRILMIPIFIIVYYLPLEWNHLISATIFAVAALTDWVDGFIARKLSSSIQDPVEKLANIIEEKSMWQRFGL